MTQLAELNHRYVDRGGVNIHYMTGGSGPLVVFVHGFPDYWYTWHHQIQGLLPTHRVAAMDTRGFNLSDAPAGVENYTPKHRVDDLAAVIANEGGEPAVVVGHDWGGATAWEFARVYPELTDRLVIVNVPHPAAMAAEMQRPNNAQRTAFAYMDDFGAADSERNLDAGSLARMVARNETDLQRYTEAFERSNFEAMMHYYRQGSPEPANTPGVGVVNVPVLQFHGLDDPVLLRGSLNNTWNHLANTLTLVTLPGAGHWAHHDRAELVTNTMRYWLRLDMPDPVVASQSAEPSHLVPKGGCCG